MSTTTIKASTDNANETRPLLRFECDYAEGCHPDVLSRLAQTNMEQHAGYGHDPHCERARELIRGLCCAPEADVQFLVGGTQTNATVIASALRPHQGVVCATSGHVAVHETGAIEARGHKVIVLPSDDGKITARQVRECADEHAGDDGREHCVQPAMVYISFPTENGTLYTLRELEDISAACRDKELLLYVDGARMGYGLAAPGNDVALADFARLCDVFYIGGTKVGALFGEAVVITNPALKRDFRYLIKQGGGLLAKGRLLGVQFCALLEDGLYARVSEHAVRLANELRAAFLAKGYECLYGSVTNQQFPVIPDAHLAVLKGRYAFSHWRRVDEGRTAVRFCTSWATTEEAVDSLIADIRAL
eukprot:m51a1_g6074 putative L-threonine aldolase (363) ;mRNA; f:291176-293180